MTEIFIISIDTQLFSLHFIHLPFICQSIQGEKNTITFTIQTHKEHDQLSKGTPANTGMLLLMSCKFPVGIVWPEKVINPPPSDTLTQKKQTKKTLQKQT